MAKSSGWMVWMGKCLLWMTWDGNTCGTCFKCVCMYVCVCLKIYIYMAMSQNCVWNVPRCTGRMERRGFVTGLVPDLMCMIYDIYIYIYIYVYVIYIYIHVCVCKYGTLIYIYMYDI